MALYIYIYNKYLLQNYAIYRFNLQDNKYEKNQQIQYVTLGKRYLIKKRWNKNYFNCIIKNLKNP